MLEKVFGFYREPKKEIGSKVINDLFIEVSNWDNSKDSISPVWDKVFKKYGRSDILKLSENELKESYENFFTNGLSEGADVGVGLKEFRSLMKYYFRGKKRLKKINQILKYIDDSSKSESEKLRNLLSLSGGYGQAWLQKINKIYYNPEVFDHVLFLLYFYKDIPPKSKLIFIGDGVGHLSNMLIKICNIDEVVFVDLPHFLARQFIVNHGKKIKMTFLTPTMFSSECLSGEYIVINQDSFPEIPEKYLKKYFSIISKGLVSKIISYNKRDNSYGHTNFSKLINENGLTSRSLSPSIFRNEYFFEVFESNE
jgi:hypothetical protein